MKLDIQKFAVSKSTSFSESNLNTTNNTSSLTITIYFSAGNNVTYFSSATLYCTCNGVTQSASVSHPKGGSVTKSFTFNNIQHNANGTKTVSWSWNCNTGTSVLGNISDSGTKALTTLHKPPLVTGYTITETNQDLIDIGIADNVFVANLSKKSVNITYTLYDNATLLRASVYNSTNQNYLSNTLPVLMDFTQNTLYTTEDGVPIYVRITDNKNSATYYSNNGVTSGRINPDFYNYINYVPISLTSSTTIAKRLGQISGRVGLNINGVYYNGVIGNVDQTSYKPIIKYKFWKYGDSEPSTYAYTIPANDITISNGTFSVSDYDIGSTIETDTNYFDPEFAYRIKIYVEDNITNTESNELQIQVGEPVWSEYPNRVDFKRITIGGYDVLESGIDNGVYYEKRADGVAICYGSVNIKNADSRSQGGLTYYTGAANIDLPITYTNTNNMICFSNVALANMNRFAQSYASVSSTSQIVVSYANTTQNETRLVMYLVIGKWL